MHAVEYSRSLQIFDRQKRKCRPKLDDRRLKLLDILPVHSGCVNSIAWDDTGRYLLSGSDDRSLVVVDPFNEPNRRVRNRISTSHNGNIFSAKFLPGAESTVSCSSDGSILVYDIESSSSSFSNIDRSNNPAVEGKVVNVYSCTTGATYEVCPVGADPWTFVACSEEGTIRWIDRRAKPLCSSACTDDVIVRCQRAVNAVDISVFKPHVMAAGCSDGTVRIYDLRCVEKGTTDEKGVVGLQSCFISSSVHRPSRVTSVEISRSIEDEHVLASLSSDCVFSFGMNKFSSDDEKISLTTQSQTDAQPSMKKVRLRGDWTDTGPRSRPETTLDQRQAGVVDGDHGGSVEAIEENTGISRLSQALTALFTRQSAAAATASRPSTSGGTDESGSPSGATEMSQSQRRREECRNRLLEEAKRRREERRQQLVDALDAVPQHPISNAYNGHRNARTVLKQAAFWGSDHVVSGSDCGHVFIWDRHTGRVSNILEADRHVVNCVQPHPNMFVLATSGIDYDIKLWAPLEEEAVDRSQEIAELVERNKHMLEETRDTVTIPAAFMLRMVAAMNRYRREHGREEGEEDEDDSDSE